MKGVILETVLFNQSARHGSVIREKLFVASVSVDVGSQYMRLNTRLNEEIVIAYRFWEGVIESEGIIKLLVMEMMFSTVEAFPGIWLRIYKVRKACQRDNSG